MPALTFPLQFTAALLAGMLVAVLWRQRAGQDAKQGIGARARTLFVLFSASGATLVVLAGLRFGYHSIVAGTLQPILAVTPAPLSCLAFQALTVPGQSGLGTCCCGLGGRFPWSHRWYRGTRHWSIRRSLRLHASHSRGLDAE